MDANSTSAQLASSTLPILWERDIVIGGEESGGIGYSRFLPERDGTLNALLLANVMAEEGNDSGHLWQICSANMALIIMAVVICIFRKQLQFAAIQIEPPRNRANVWAAIPS